MWIAVLHWIFFFNEQNKRGNVGDAWDCGYIHWNVPCVLTASTALEKRKQFHFVPVYCRDSFLVSSFTFHSSTQLSDWDFQNGNWIVSLSCLQFLKCLCATCWNHPNSLVYHDSTLISQLYFSPLLNFIFNSDHSEKLFFAQMGHTLLCLCYLSGPSPSS